MTPPVTSTSISKPTEATAFPDLTRVSEMNGTMLNESAKFNAQIGTTLQTMVKEWTEFVGTRLREDVQLFQQIHNCRSLEDLQQTYAQFWQTAFTQYGDEAKRLLNLTQGAADDAARAAQELRETVTSQVQSTMPDRAHDKAA